VALWCQFHSSVAGTVSFTSRTLSIGCFPIEFLDGVVTFEVILHEHKAEPFLILRSPGRE
jgi:hypothetical protein